MKNTKVPHVSVYLEKGILYINKPKGCTMKITDKDFQDGEPRVTNYAVAETVHERRVS